MNVTSEEYWSDWVSEWQPWLPYIFAALFALFSYLFGEMIHVFVSACFTLFLSRKFEGHRIGGLLFLTQYIAAWMYYLYDKDSFIDSWLVLTVPFSGMMQAVTASIYFTFLPKKVDPAFMGDKYSISYAFVVENVFFAMLLCYQWWSMSEHITPYIPAVAHFAFIFFPYVWRPLFPKTSFRESLYNTANKSSKHFQFFTNSTWFVKIFYVFSKHFIGYFLNYIRYLDRLDRAQRVDIFFIMLVAQFSTTVAMFLHTLAFKGYITKKFSMQLYLASLVVLLYAWTAVYSMILSNLDLAALCLIGCALNFKSKYWQHSWQVLVFGALVTAKLGYHNYF